MSVRTLNKILGSHFNKLIDKLTITYPQKMGAPKIAKIYKYLTIGGVHCICLPRFTGKVLLEGKIIKNIDILLPPISRIECKLQHELYENQELIVNYLMSYVYAPEIIATGFASCTLNLRAGMGKTFVAAGLISRLKMRTLYIVPKRPLMMQAVNDLQLCFYDPETEKQMITVGAFGGKEKRICDITVIVINSAILQSMEWFANFSLIIFDEVHMLCSEERREIFWQTNAQCNFAISATTENRNDGFDAVFHKHIGEIIRAENIDGFTYDDIKFNLTARIIHYKGPEEYVKNLKHQSTDMIFTHYMHNQFIADPYRLKLAVNELVYLYDWKGPNNQIHNIYVFAEELGILRIAMDAFAGELMMRERNDVAADISAPELKIEMFTGKIKPNEIKEVIDRGRILFTTYGLAGTGLSVTKMTAALYLTSRKSGFLQIVPRILRRGSDLEIPRIIVDIVDAKTALKWQLPKRIIAYDHYGAEKNEITMSYKDIKL